MTARTPRNIAKILGVDIIGTELAEVLSFVAESIAQNGPPRVIFTPNPEFLVAARKDAKFRQILNQADLNVPDGIGLILLSRLMGQKIKERISGADLVKSLLEMGDKEGWSVGIVGVRKGDWQEAAVVLQRLKTKYPNTNFINLDDPKLEIRNLKFEIVLACHGMVKQEQWILENKDKIRANVFIGIGGSLDFLTGFTSRAPEWLREIGLEWLWRGLTKPGHWGRVWRAVVVFPWLVIRDEILSSKS